MNSNRENIIMGVPLKYVSLATLTLQNSALTILLHHSRTVVPPSKMYSAPSAVLLNEILKGSISLVIACHNALHSASASSSVSSTSWDKQRYSLQSLSTAAGKLSAELLSADAWKLSIPAILYVIQNNLQFVAAANLDVPTFQVTYNLKILTTALFSVIMLKRRLTPKKWLALLCLAAGVGIVQLQSTSQSSGSSTSAGSHPMDPTKGLIAVALACVTSGLAGVYFEMVLKGSRTDLWIRNVQLSFFSLLPALVPVFLPDFSIFAFAPPSFYVAPRQAIFAHFGFWAWAVVLTQVVGGLVTALVIKYSDNIMKGFATSLAIVLSFIAGVILFDFDVTASFVIGSAVVVSATYLYNSPDQRINLTHRLPTSAPPTPASEKSQAALESMYIHHEGSNSNLSTRHPTGPDLLSGYQARIPEVGAQNQRAWSNANGGAPVLSSPNPHLIDRYNML